MLKLLEGWRSGVTMRICRWTTLTSSTTATGAKETGGDHPPVRGGERDGVEHPLQERQVDRCDLEEQTDHHRRPEPTVREQPAVNADRVWERALKAWKTWARASVMNAIVVAWRRPSPSVPCQRMPTPEGQERDPREQQPLPDDQADETAGRAAAPAGRAAGASSRPAPTAPGPGPRRGRCR